MQSKSDFLNILRDFKNISDHSLQVGEKNINITSKGFCMNSFKKANRYKNIIFLQNQVRLKLQLQLLKQIQDCSNFRQRVRRLIAKYKKLKSELQRSQ
uniref:Uncharacterized protein LOC108038950 n=1 Tax=Drosophila rhopaloa TaxID=1041015 RepID=A0A6P4E7Y3_DRORH